MRYAERVEDGFLAVYSVADEDEARALLTLACPMSYDREFIAEELAREQTMDNLQAFSDRLHEAHSVLVETGRCRCKERT